MTQILISTVDGRVMAVENDAHAWAPHEQWPAFAVLTTNAAIQAVRNRVNSEGGSIGAFVSIADLTNAQAEELAETGALEVNFSFIVLATAPGQATKIQALAKYVTDIVQFAIDRSTGRAGGIISLDYSDGDIEQIRDELLGQSLSNNQDVSRATHEFFGTGWQGDLCG